MSDKNPTNPVSKHLHQKLSHLCGGILAALSGFVGYTDASLAGMVVGIVLGLGLGEALGLTCASVILLFRRQLTETLPSDDECSPPPTSAERTRRFLLPLVLFAAWVVLWHEGPVLVNLAALSVNHDAGARLTQATARGDSRERLREELKGRQWQHEIFTARPLRWWLGDEVTALNQANLALSNVLNGRGILKPGEGWKETLTAKALVALWRSDHWAAQAVTDRSLNALGAMICERSRDEIDKLRVTSWGFRHLPKKWFQE